MGRLLGRIPARSTARKPLSARTAAIPNARIPKARASRGWSPASSGWIQLTARPASRPPPTQCPHPEQADRETDRHWIVGAALHWPAGHSRRGFGRCLASPPASSIKTLIVPMATQRFGSDQCSHHELPLHCPWGDCRHQISGHLRCPLASQAAGQQKTPASAGVGKTSDGKGWLSRRSRRPRRCWPGGIGWRCCRGTRQRPRRRSHPARSHWRIPPSRPW